MRILPIRLFEAIILQSTFWSTSRLRIFRKHLLMLLLAFGWLFVNSQVAVASHDCPVELSTQSLSLQHNQHMLMKADMDSVNSVKMKGALCEKHCIPDVMQKDNGHSSLIALPVTHTLALVVPECTAAVAPAVVLTPPATGPPATIRFCRFRE